LRGGPVFFLQLRGYPFKDLFLLAGSKLGKMFLQHLSQRRESAKIPQGRERGRRGCGGAGGSHGEELPAGNAGAIGLGMGKGGSLRIFFFGH